MKAKFLAKNDIVDAVSLGTACTFDELEKIKNFLKKIALQPSIFLEKELSLKKSVAHEFPSFVASKRFEQFKKAVESDSKIIWCTRGGYGSAELLQFLEKMRKPKNRKIFIGFSDISALNKILIEQWNWQVITAPMLAQIVLDKVSKKSVSAILDLIFGKVPELKYSLKLISGTAKSVSAILTGGCLSVLASSFGTKNQLNWHDKILFLEDEGENGERLDRYFNHLIEIMLESKKFPRAIILGNFLQASPNGTPEAKNIKIALERFSQKLAERKIDITVFAEKTKCLGHSKNMMPLVLGADTKITANNFLIQKF
jgi:muramoyltetrapeptide carboxypeptidase